MRGEGRRGSWHGTKILGAIVFFGWLGDRISRRHPIFLFGLLNLLAATLILALGRRIEILILGRILQGISASVVWTSGLGLLTDIFGQERYGEAVGYANTAVSVGTTTAPLLGGLVYSNGGYAAVSIMSAGVLAFSLLLAFLMVEPKPADPLADFKSHAGTGHGNGYVNGHANGHAKGHANGHANGNANSTNGRPHDHAHTADSEDADESSPLISDKPLQPCRRSTPAYGLLLRSPRILAAMGGVFTFSFVMISMEGMIPLFVKDTFGWSSTQAALTYLAWIIPGFLAPAAGKASDRYGSRWIAISGLLFTVPPLILMRMVTFDSDSQKVLLCSLLSLVGESCDNPPLPNFLSSTPFPILHRFCGLTFFAPCRLRLRLGPAALSC